MHNTKNESNEDTKQDDQKMKLVLPCLMLVVGLIVMYILPLFFVTVQVWQITLGFSGMSLLAFGGYMIVRQIPNDESSRNGNVTPL